MSTTNDEGTPVDEATVELLGKLRRFGRGDATAGFRYLCAATRVCSVCGRDWMTDGNARCDCSAARR